MHVMGKTVLELISLLQSLENYVEYIDIGKHTDFLPTLANIEIPPFYANQVNKTLYVYQRGR